MTFPTVFQFVLLAAATWRLASLFANEDGPFKIFSRLRQTCRGLHKKSRVFRTTDLYHGLLCEWCNSVWFGTLIAAGWYFQPLATTIIAFPLALSTFAVLTKYIVQTLEAVKNNQEGMQDARAHAAMQDYGAKKAWTNPDDLQPGYPVEETDRYIQELEEEIAELKAAREGIVAHAKDLENTLATYRNPLIER